MRTALKWLGIILGGLLGLVLLAVIIVFYLTEQRLNKTYDVAVDAVEISSGQDTRQRGEQLVRSAGFCVECHGQNLAGQIMDDDPVVGRLVAPNLTSGAGGVGAIYTDVDWVRAIRHGIGPDRKSLIVMPSNYFYRFSDKDLGAIIAYLKSLPPVDNQLPNTFLGPMGRMFILQDPSLFPAAVIDHTAPRPPAPEPGVTAEYGKYMANSCTLCHGEELAGGTHEGGGPNLTRGGELATWTHEDFKKALRTGIAPDGKILDPEQMPVESTNWLSDDEISAIWLYIQSLPAVEVES